MAIQTGRTPAKERLSRERWLATALDLLAKEGSSRITVRHICAVMGVSTGSLYWHFDSSQDFLHSIVDFWADRYTKSAVDSVAALAAAPEEKLLQLMNLIAAERLTSYDIPVRAWAAQDEYVAAVVEKADRLRLATVKNLFLDIGLPKAEADIRARTLIGYFRMDPNQFDKSSDTRRRRTVRKLHQWFVRT